MFPGVQKRELWLAGQSIVLVFGDVRNDFEDISSASVVSICKGEQQSFLLRTGKSLITVLTSEVPEVPVVLDR